MISVVIPLFNKSKFILRAVDSIINQTVKPEEIIIVDDGSNDGGADLVERFFSQNVTIIRQKNMGVSYARNKGVAISRCEYIAFCDADDYWHPNHIENLILQINKIPSGVLFSNFHYIKANNKIYLPNKKIDDGWIGCIENFIKSYSCNFGLVNATTACVSRSALLKVGGFPVGVTRGEDVIVWIKLSMIGCVVHNCVPTAVYNQDIINSATKNISKSIPDSILFICQLMNSSLDEKNDLKVMFRRISISTAAGFLMNGDNLGAREISKLLWSNKFYISSVGLFFLSKLPLCFIQTLKSGKYFYLKIKNNLKIN